jgi:hypothetical protein
MRTPLFITGVLALAAAAHGAGTTFNGYARSLDTGQLLYVESHAVSSIGTPAETRVVLYRCGPGAAPFARKDLSYGGQRIAPAFTFIDARSGYAEGLRREAGRLEVFERAGPTAQTRTEYLPAANALVADAGFDEFVRAQWDALERGEAVGIPFLVPSRLDSVKFRVRKVSETQIEGEAANVFRLSVAGPLSWFVSDIDISYRKSDRRLLRYRGITNIRDTAGELIAAQIDFPEADRSDRAVDLAALRALPLVSQCK